MPKGFYLLLLTIFALSLQAEGKRDTSPAVPETVVMKTVYIEGEVKINNETASLGQVVPAGSSVTTGSSGYCEIRFADKNIFRIGPDTVTRLDIGSGKGNIQLEKGQMALLLEKLDALLLDDGFTLTTALSTAGIRGTAFFVKVESPESVYLCCCNGSIDMTDKRGGTPYSLESRHHQAVRYTYDGKSYRADAAPLLYHDDEGMDSLGESIDYAIPWDSGYSDY